MEYLKISEILPNPFQPRRRFDAQELGELAKSIKEYGVIEPLLVRINGSGQFELVAGERRLRAAKLAKMEQVPVVLKDYDDRKTAQVALIENLQRADLNAIEEAKAYKTLTADFGMTQDEAARRAGKSRSHIANFMRLLRLSGPVQDLLSEGKLNMGQAKPLLALEDKDAQLEAAWTIIEKDLSARGAESLVKKLLSGAPLQKAENAKEKEAKRIEAQAYADFAQERLKQVLGTKVSIKQGKKKSRIEIEFYSEDDLERLIELLIQEKNERGGESSAPRKIIDFNV